MANQISMFEMIYPSFKLDKPVRLIELFAGYGSQALALKYLGIPFEHWKICEWAVKSIQAYRDVHFTDAEIETDLSKEQLVEYLTNKGISSNYNEPMTRQQIERLGEKQLRTIYENILITHNLVNVQQVQGKDLEIIDKGNYIYILTYSFPCQDLSLAGLRKGMSDNSTRSGMLWEVERILNECEEKPQLLLMENVPQVHSEDSMPDFIRWIKSLEKMGYKNYWQDLIATDYGIPQTRNRTFMVSTLGDYNYSFPDPIPLQLRLKDLIEDNVDEKYFLSQAMQNYFAYNTEKQKAKGNGFKFEPTEGNGNAKTITVKSGGRMDDNFILMDKADRVGGLFDGDKKHQAGSIYNPSGSSPCLDTASGGYRTPSILIKNATQQGYLEAEEGDGVDISSRMEYHRGTVQKCKAQTILRNGVGGVVVKDE